MKDESNKTSRASRPVPGTSCLAPAPWALEVPEGRPNIAKGFSPGNGADVMIGVEVPAGDCQYRLPVHWRGAGRLRRTKHGAEGTRRGGRGRWRRTEDEAKDRPR